MPSVRLKIDGETLERLYVREMWPSDRIADYFGCSKPTVLLRLHELGIKVRHHNDTKRGKPSRNRVYIKADELIKEYRQKNASLASVGKKYGVKSDTIRRILVEAGHPIKSLSEVIRGSRFGKSNPNWNENLTAKERRLKRDTYRASRWRSAVYARDYFSCQCCGDARGGNLNAHHIRNHATNKKLRWKISNGITLCDECHRGFHKEFGYSNNDELQIGAYISNRKRIAA